MAPPRSRRPRPPLDSARLHELALSYVGRFATSRARLLSYLARKVRERGWDAPGEPGLEAIADRFCELGYIDDAAYALAKSRALSHRGYGKRRVEEALGVAGIAEDDRSNAREHARRNALDAALRFAERRRIGPFGHPNGDPRKREKDIAAMVRAGHSFALARAIVCWPGDLELDRHELADRAGLADA
jgi:regulatory protein